MGKDPAFLFYSKDWLEGTGEMTPEEKGVYVDLLAHQHQKGSLPIETKRLSKLVGLSEAEFSEIWVHLSSKFIANASGRLVNRKLNGIVSERLDKGWRNTIVGTLGAIVRYAIKNEGNDPQIAEKVKKTFKVDDFLACDKETLSERISIWFSECYNKCYESIANANGDVDKDKIGMSLVGENGWSKMPGPEATELALPDIKEGSVIQLLLLATGKQPTKSQVQSLWRIFKTQHFTGKKFYDSPEEAYSHFINWSKNQKINGTTHRGGNSNSAPTPTIVTGTGSRNF